MRLTLTASFGGLFFSFCITGNTQYVTADTILNRQLSAAIESYHKAVFPENALYNGSEYLPNNIAFVNGQPYFLSNRPLSGSVLYKGLLYENLRLMYDLTRQQLVLIHPVNIQRIKLNTPDIKQFTLDNHLFLNLQTDQQPAQNIPAGIYELLFKGKVTRLIKNNKKTITEELTSSSGVLYFIREENSYYIEHGGRYFPLSNRRSVLRAFSDRKKEMNQFLKTNSVSPQANKEAAYKLIAAYYDQLKST